MNKTAVLQLIQDFSIETTPRGLSKLAPLAQYLPAQTRVFITFLPGVAFADTVRSAQEIAAQGFTPVVHVAARNLQSQAELQEGLEALQAGGIRDLLLLAGGSIHTRSPFQNALEILDSGILESFDWRSIGFAGHPEGHPDVQAEELRRALEIKWQYARQYPREYYLATQFCFQAEPVIAWRQSLLAADIHFPLRLGVAGLANTAALIRHAQLCGVGPSINFLIKNAGVFRRLLGGVAAPGRLVADLAQAVQDGSIDEDVRLHFFPLGDFSRTTAWITAIQAGKFYLDHQQGVHIEQ